MPPCSEAGILGPVAGVIGSLQAVEVVKELLGLGQSLVGRLLLYEALSARFTTVTYAWDPENPLNGKSPRFFDLSHHRVALADVSNGRTGERLAAFANGTREKGGVTDRNPPARVDLVLVRSGDGTIGQPSPYVMDEG